MNRSTLANRAAFAAFIAVITAPMVALLVIAAVPTAVPFKVSLVLNVALACVAGFQRLVITDSRAKTRARDTMVRHWKESAALKEDYIHDLSKALRAANKERLSKPQVVVADEALIDRNVELRRVAMLALGHIDDQALVERLLPLPQFGNLRDQVREDVVRFRRDKADVKAVM